jgi:hypothetical protein
MEQESHIWLAQFEVGEAKIAKDLVAKASELLGKAE